MLLIMYRPAYFRGIDVWHLSAPEEDETYQDHAYVVPALNSWENVFSFHAQIIMHGVLININHRATLVSH